MRSSIERRRAIGGRCDIVCFRFFNGLASGAGCFGPASPIGDEPTAGDTPPAVVCSGGAPCAPARPSPKPRRSARPVAAGGERQLRLLQVCLPGAGRSNGVRHNCWEVPRSHGERLDRKRATLGATVAGNPDGFNGPGRVQTRSAKNNYNLNNSDTDDQKARRKTSAAGIGAYTGDCCTARTTVPGLARMGCPRQRAFRAWTHDPRHFYGEATMPQAYLDSARRSVSYQGRSTSNPCWATTSSRHRQRVSTASYRFYPHIRSPTRAF